VSTHNFELPDDFVRRISDPSFKGAADVFDRIPDEIGYKIGWRTWKVSPDLPAYGLPPKIHSVTHPYFWAPRKAMRAECAFGHDEHVPGETCYCGFYSAKTLNHLAGMHYHQYSGSTWLNIVGKVANWGKVIEGTQGWRAEWAYPLEFYIPFEYLASLGKPIRDGYGVPIKPMNVLGLTPSEDNNEGED
jgi:hypothetical protein